VPERRAARPRRPGRLPSARDLAAIAAMPKTELHMHVDGSIPAAKTWALMRRHELAPVSTFAEMKRLLSLQPEEEGSLLAYLDKFHYPMWITQFYENIREVTEAIVIAAARQGVRVLELRYSPVIHTYAGITLRQSIRAVLSGMNSARDRHPIKTGLVVIAMRQHGPHIAKILARGALSEAEHLHERSGVVGFDIAGPEHGNPPRLFAEAYDIARRGGLGLTAHAGEAGPARYVWESVDVLGVRRIGHGCAAAGDPALLRRLARDRILVECCPSSNYQTGAVRRGEPHPIMKFLEAGVPVAICADNTTVSSTDPVRESARLLGGLSLSQIRAIHRNAAEHTFIGRTAPPGRSKGGARRGARALLLALGILLAGSAAPAAAEDAAPSAPPPPAAAPGNTSHTPPSRLPPELKRFPTSSPPMSDLEQPATDADADATMQRMLPLLAASSRRYESYARRFTCTERIREADYGWSSGEAGSERSHTYAYLLLFDEDHSRYDVLRNPVSKNGQVESGTAHSVDLPAPDAYAWTFLFSTRNQRVLHFYYVGREIKDYRLCHVIDFVSSIPVVEGHDPREWSGTVWIEDGTWNFVRIEADPSFQERRLTGQWRLYTESMNLPWGKLKPRPRGQRIEVEFNYFRDGLLFPTRVDLREFVWVGRGTDITDSRTTMDYTDYRFFQTGTQVVVPEAQTE